MIDDHDSVQPNMMIMLFLPLVRFVKAWRQAWSAKLCYWWRKARIHIVIIISKVIMMTMMMMMMMMIERNCKSKYSFYSFQK